MFSAMTVIKSRSNKIYANILKGMQARECHDGIALLMFANDCVNLESSSRVSSFRLEYSVQRFLELLFWLLPWLPSLQLPPALHVLDGAHRFGVKLILSLCRMGIDGGTLSNQSKHEIRGNVSISKNHP